MRNVLLIPIPRDAWEKAIGWVKIKKRTGFDKVVRNYTNLEEPLRYEIGYVGELCWDDLLARRGKRYIYEVHLDGHGHASEFTVYRRTGEPKTLDVKTCGVSYGKNLLVPVEQFNRHTDVDVYVGIRLVNDTTAALEGWITRDDLATYPRRKFKCLSVACPNDDLTDIEELLDDLQNEFPVSAGGQLELF